MDFSCPRTVITGSKDKNIKIIDTRTASPFVYTNNHTQGVCGLKVNPHNKNIFVSGGNDNNMVLYDLRKENPIWITKGHKAAIRAITWDG